MPRYCHPTGFPAAAIALHGAADYFGRPQMESVEAAPRYLNTQTVGTNPVKTLLTTATLSSSVDQLVFTIEDDHGTSQTDKILDGTTDRTYSWEWVSLSLQDGEYQVAAQAQSAGILSDTKRAPFTVDNTPPEVELQGTTATISGTWTVRGRVHDVNLERYAVESRPTSSGVWETVTTGTSDWPLMAPLATINTKTRHWNGPRVIRLTGWDKAGNSSTTETSIETANDYQGPQVGFTRADGTALCNGESLEDLVNFRLSADELPNPGGRGLASLRFLLESEDFPDKSPVLLYEKTSFAPAERMSFSASPITLHAGCENRVLKRLRASAGAMAKRCSGQARPRRNVR